MRHSREHEKYLPCLNLILVLLLWCLQKIHTKNKKKMKKKNPGNLSLLYYYFIGGRKKNIVIHIKMERYINQI